MFRHIHILFVLLLKHALSQEYSSLRKRDTNDSSQFNPILTLSDFVTADTDYEDEVSHPDKYQLIVSGFEAEGNPKGVSFSREISFIEEGYSVSIVLGEDHCEEIDSHGSNQCHYDWGNTIHAEIENAQYVEPFNADDTLEGKFKIDALLPWEFSCSLCGSDCILELPITKEEFIIKMPPCPLTTKNTPKSFEIALDDESPTFGIPAHVVGEIYIQRKGGDKIVNVDVHALVK